MDPLSVTLAVVSLATAVKDLAELGDKIYSSFTKVSNNLRNAQRIAKEIKEMVEEIKVFCEDHEGALENMKDFRSALQGLLAKFRSVETSILPLLPQAGGRRRDFFIREWDAWRNHNKAEGIILDLQSDIVKVMRKYMMRSSMRTEVKLEAIRQETSSGLADVHKDMAQGLKVLEVVRRDVSTLRITTAAIPTIPCLHSSSRISSDEFTHNVVTFAQSTPSTSAPMLRTPNVITEELLTAAYIKLQINSIVTALEKLPTQPTSTPNDIEKFWFALPIELASMDITRIRHQVVKHAILIRDYLDERMETVSMHAGAAALNDLLCGLGALDMQHECYLVGDWVVKLARTLVDASNGGHPDCRSALALYLLNQSRHYFHIDDRTHSLQIIEEAYAITQTLRNQFSGDAQFQMLYSAVLLQYARLVDSLQRSTEMCIEALQVLEDIFNIRTLCRSESHGTTVNIVRPISSSIDRIFASEPPITAIMVYTDGLQRLGAYLFWGGHYDSAPDFGLLAIAMHRKLVFTHGPQYKAYLAMALSKLVQHAAASWIPTEELVSMADECIQLLRELAQKNPLPYARELVRVLWAKAFALRLTPEAIATYEESVSLAGQILQDTELRADALDHLSNHFRVIGRHDDAVRTGMLAIMTHHGGAEIQASRYYSLCDDFCQLNRYKEAAEAAQTSLTFYRYLAVRDPDTSMGDLAMCVSTLARCLATLGNFHEAQVAWNESSGMLEKFLSTNVNANSPEAIRYKIALSIYKSISQILEDEEECLKISSTATRYYYKLSETSPQDPYRIGDMLWARYHHAFNMLRFGHLQDAQEYIEDSLRQESHPTQPTLEYGIMHWKAAMITLKADVLDAMGCTLMAIQIVDDIGKVSVNTDQAFFHVMINSMMKKVQLLVSLDNGDEAILIAEEALQLSREIPKSNLGPIDDNVVAPLHGVAFTALSCSKYERAIDAAQEGYNISAGLDWEEGHDLSIRPRLFAILSCAEANLGRYSTALEHAHCAVDAALSFGSRKSSVSPTAAEQSYMETRGNLADVLLATGDIDQALRICEERRDYFSKRVDKRMGEYRDLAPILRMLGVLFCNEGRHKEGEATAQELTRIVNTLGIAFPSLQEQVKIRLRNQAKAPIFKAVDSLCQKLDCKHQTEISFMFEM